MSNIEKFVQEYLKGDDAAIYRIVAAFGDILFQNTGILSYDRSLEKYDLLSEMVEGAWKALRGGMRDAGLLYRRLQLDLRKLAQKVIRVSQIRLPITETEERHLQSAVVDDEDLLLLRVQLGVCLKRLARRGRVVQDTAQLLYDGWTQRDAAERLGIPRSRLRALVEQQIYPEFRKSLEEWRHAC